MAFPLQNYILRAALIYWCKKEHRFILAAFAYVFAAALINLFLNGFPYDFKAGKFFMKFFLSIIMTFPYFYILHISEKYKETNIYLKYGHYAWIGIGVFFLPI